MIRFRLKECMAELEFKRGKRVSMEEIAKATGVHRTTLSKISNVKGYNTTTEVLNKLCKYFECEIQDIAMYVEDLGV
jgi:putative transcriptional regulator